MHSTVHAGFRLEEGRGQHQAEACGELTCQVEAVAGRWHHSQQQPEELPLLAPP